jgi:hypothetical protein
MTLRYSQCTIRHYSVDSLTGLVEALEAFAADRDTHGKHERARGAREAAQRLTEGAHEVDFERVTYRVGDKDRYSTVEGAQADILAELDQAGRGWLQAGKEGLARQAARAMGMIERGETTARVGHLEYIVTCNTA